MSNEISIQIQMSCTKGEFNIPPMGTPQSIDQTGEGGGCPGYMNIGTSEEDISLAELTTPGYVYIKNIGALGTDTAAVVTYGPKSGTMVAFGELREGEEACFRLTTDTPTFTIKSSVANTGVQVVILED